MAAQFEIAFDATMTHEGLNQHTKDPRDPGKETYSGISRRAWPGWPGWKMLDERSKGTALIPADYQQLGVWVREFYLDQYWSPLSLESMPQDLANELFDTAVNMSKRMATRFLQRALNALNRQEGLWPDLLVDGKFGGQTLSMTHRAVASSETRMLVKLLNIQQGARYLELMEANPILEAYARGWLERT